MSDATKTCGDLLVHVEAEKIQRLVTVAGLYIRGGVPRVTIDVGDLYVVLSALKELEIERILYNAKDSPAPAVLLRELLSEIVAIWKRGLSAERFVEELLRPLEDADALLRRPGSTGRNDAPAPGEGERP